MDIFCKLVISETGKIAQIFHENGRLVAEILVHGPLLKTALACHKELPIVIGRPNVFRGELYGLAGWEYLNVEEERIEEKTI
jgi:hypothetical protein